MNPIDATIPVVYPQRSVYLAGPIKGQSYAQATSWRKDFTDSVHRGYGLLLHVYDPMRGKEALSFETKLDSQEYAGHILANDKAVTRRDRWCVQRADLMIAYLGDSQQVSIGTCIEFGWADAFGTPIIAVLDERHNHGMLKEIATYIVPSLAHVIEFLPDILML